MCRVAQKGIFMIDHTGIGVSDYVKSHAFYVSALAPLGYEVRKQLDMAAGFGAGALESGDDPGGDFWIHAGSPASPRTHIAFRARNRSEVDAFFAAALAAGGRDNGAPGLRELYHPHYYAAFVFDPDGYNIEAVCHLPPAA